MVLAQFRQAAYTLAMRLVSGITRHNNVPLTSRLLVIMSVLDKLHALGMTEHLIRDHPLRCSQHPNQQHPHLRRLHRRRLQSSPQLHNYIH